MAVDANTSGSVSAGSGIIYYFSRNSVAANLTMVLLLLGGLLAGRGLTSQVFPTIDPGVVTVTVPSPGATPSEVEESITRRASLTLRASPKSKTGRTRQPHLQFYQTVRRNTHAQRCTLFGPIDRMGSSA